MSEILFWHGGDLDNYNPEVSGKAGRMEYGAGLYLTSDWNAASKYAKGSRKMYLVKVKQGTHLNDVKLSALDASNFVKKYGQKSKQKDALSAIERRTKESYISGSTFQAIMINYEVLNPQNSLYLRKFLLQNGADYYIESTSDLGIICVIFNPEKVLSIERVNRSDKNIPELINKVASQDFGV